MVSIVVPALQPLKNNPGFETDMLIALWLRGLKSRRLHKRLQPQSHYHPPTGINGTMHDSRTEKRINFQHVIHPQQTLRAGTAFGAGRRE